MSTSPKDARSSRRKAILSLCAVLLIIGAILAAFGQIRRYAMAAIAASSRHPLKRIVMVDTPSYLPRAILDSLAQEAVDYTIFNRRHPKYAAEIRNPLDGHILKVLAAHYIHHPDLGYNAWIRQIVFIRRNMLPNEQIIEIAATYRRPAAFLKIQNKYYLISRSGLRLPGIYTAAQHAQVNWLYTLTGYNGDLPKVGHAFNAKSIAAGLALARLLRNRPYSRQIADINVAGVGKPSQKRPQIILITRWHTQVYWGQPPGVRSFFEVPTDRKLEYLQAIYHQYHRIDAGYAFVDLRGDQVLVPSGAAATQPVYAPVTPTYPN